MLENLTTLWSDRPRHGATRGRSVVPSQTTLPPPHTGEQKIADQHRAGLLLTEEESPMDLATAEAKRARLEQRQAEAQDATAAARRSVEHLRAERVQAIQAERTGPAAADIVAAEAAVLTAQGVVEDIAAAVVLFLPAWHRAQLSEWRRQRDVSEAGAAEHQEDAAAFSREIAALEQQRAAADGHYNEAKEESERLQALVDRERKHVAEAETAAAAKLAGQREGLGP